MDNPIQMKKGAGVLHGLVGKTGGSNYVIGP